MSEKDLKRKAIEAWERVEEIEQQKHEARNAWYIALREYSNALGAEVYGFQVGDVIEFTKRDSMRGKSETVRMKILYFDASPDRDHDDRHPSIHGVRVKKDGTVGTKEEYCYPSLREYSNVRKVD